VCFSQKLERFLGKYISRSMLTCKRTFWEQNDEEKTKNKVVYSTVQQRLVGNSITL
jgi:hypothetical protein